MRHGLRLKNVEDMEFNQYGLLQKVAFYFL